jgi:hypothetical protein
MQARILVIGCGKRARDCADFLRECGHAVNHHDDFAELECRLEFPHDVTVVYNLRDAEGAMMSPGETARMLVARQKTAGEVVMMLDGNGRPWNDRRHLYDAGVASVLECDVEFAEIASLAQAYRRRSAQCPTGVMTFAGGRLVVDTQAKVVTLDGNPLELDKPRKQPKGKKSAASRSRAPGVGYSTFETLAAANSNYVSREDLAYHLGYDLMESEEEEEDSDIAIDDDAPMLKHLDKVFRKVVALVRATSTKIKLTTGISEILSTSRARGFCLAADRVFAPVVEMPLSEFLPEQVTLAADAVVADMPLSDFVASAANTNESSVNDNAAAVEATEQPMEQTVRAPSFRTVVTDAPCITFDCWSQESTKDKLCRRDFSGPIWKQAAPPVRWRRFTNPRKLTARSFPPSLSATDRETIFSKMATQLARGMTPTRLEVAFDAAVQVAMTRRTVRQVPSQRPPQQVAPDQPTTGTLPPLQDRIACDIEFTARAVLAAYGLPDSLAYELSPNNRPAYSGLLPLTTVGVQIAVLEFGLQGADFRAGQFQAKGGTVVLFGIQMPTLIHAIAPRRIPDLLDSAAATARGIIDGRSVADTSIAEDTAEDVRFTAAAHAPCFASIDAEKCYHLATQLVAGLRDAGVNPGLYFSSACIVGERALSHGMGMNALAEAGAAKVFAAMSKVPRIAATLERAPDETGIRRGENHAGHTEAHFASTIQEFGTDKGYSQTECEDAPATLETLPRIDVRTADTRGLMLRVAFGDHHRTHKDYQDGKIAAAVRQIGNPYRRTDIHPAAVAVPECLRSSFSAFVAAQGTATRRRCVGNAAASGLRRITTCRGQQSARYSAGRAWTTNS